MVDRVLITPGQLRISRPGDDVKTTPLAELLFHEQMRPFSPKTTLTYAFSGSGSHSITLPSGFDEAPFCVLKSSDNTIAAFGNYFGQFSNDQTRLEVLNMRNIARTITAYIFNQTPLTL